MRDPRSDVLETNSLSLLYIKMTDGHIEHLVQHGGASNGH